MEVRCAAAANIYFEAGCSGTPIKSTSLPGDVPCAEITCCGSCSSNADDEINVVPYIIGFVVAIALLAGLLAFLPDKYTRGIRPCC